MLQYQALAEPLLEVSSETITSDKWQPRFRDVTRVLPRSLAALVAGAVLPPTFAQGHADPPTAWRPTFPSLVPADRRRSFIALRQFAQPMFGVEVDVPVMSWTGSFPDYVWRRRQPVERGRVALPLFVPDVTQPVTALSWRPTFADRVPPRVSLRAALQRAYQADRFDAPAAVPAPALSWQGRYPDRVPPVVRLRASQQQFVAWSTHTPPETVPDWFKPVIDVPVRAILRPPSSAVAPLYVADVTVSVPVQWAPVYPSQIWRTEPPVEWVYVTDPTTPASATVVTAPARYTFLVRLAARTNIKTKV